MCFNREKQEYMWVDNFCVKIKINLILFSFNRWSIGGPYDDTSQQVLHLKEDNLSEFLETNIVKDLFKVW